MNIYIEKNSEKFTTGRSKAIDKKCSCIKKKKKYIK